jgi:hypothetical protein
MSSELDEPIEETKKTQYKSKSPQINQTVKVDPTLNILNNDLKSLSPKKNICKE